MSEAKEDKVVPLSQKAYDRLNRAKKEGESFSDVIMRLSSTKLFGLQRRGEMDIVTSDRKKLQVVINQDLCLGAESCATLLPEVFALDDTQLGGFKRGAEPLGMMEVEEGTVDSESVIRAAQSCPYKSISVRDLATGEETVR